MSRIYFHSEHGTAEVSGAERAHCGATCAQIASALLYLRWKDDPIAKMLPANSYIHGADFERRFRTAFENGGLKLALPDGRTVDSFTTILNTVVGVGSDVLRFMARLHGQCEVHGFVSGPNRRWLAEIIGKGLDKKLLRRSLHGHGHDLGWPGVVELLRSRDDGAVVTSYSVCDAFPNSHGLCRHCLKPERWHHKNEKIGGGDPIWLCVAQSTNRFEDMKRYTPFGDDSDLFWKVPESEQWRSAVDALHGRGLEWKPDDWATQSFGEGLTVMDVREIADGLEIVP